MDPSLSLAFSLHHQRGIYALLLGSGVSKAAQIPTGWDIAKDLVRKVACLHGEKCEPDSLAWYRERFQQEADYSVLLRQLAPSPSERQGLLRPYFEPTEDEQTQGIKLPTTAHKAIARLIRDGYIRVVITTNFDRLLETALAEIGGKPPVVVASPEAIDGSLPISHPGTYIYKLHGDYLDTRLKNTEQELSRYDRRINRQLDRIFDEFGLIVCGWSADWDPALRAALERCKNRRFSTHWTHIGPISASAQGLANLRGAIEHPIVGADSFFSELEDKVRSLADLDRPHPLSTDAAVSSVKRFIADEKHKIRFSDLFDDAARQLAETLSPQYFSPEPNPRDERTLSDYVVRYDSLCETLVAMLVTAARWAEPHHVGVMCKAITRVAAQPEHLGGLTAFLAIRNYPAYLLIYAAAMSALEAGKYSTFLSLLTRAQVTDRRGDTKPAVLALSDQTVLEDRKWLWPLFNGKQQKTPLSDHLLSVLTGPIGTQVVGRQEYARLFEKFQYLYALVYADSSGETGRVWVPVGRLSWMYGDALEYGGIRELNEEMKRLGEDWHLLRAGLCDGSVERLREVKKSVDEHMVLAYQNGRF